MSNNNVDVNILVRRYQERLSEAMNQIILLESAVEGLQEQVTNLSPEPAEDAEETSN